MNDLQRQISDERERRLRQELETLAWQASPFNRTTAVVDVPTGELAVLVAEFMPLVKRRFWQKGIVGISPDGRTRATVTSKYELDRSLTRAELRLLKRTGYLPRTKRCYLFLAAGYKGGESALDRYNQVRFVMLQDGRAGYRGSLDDVRAAFVRTIATNEVSDNGMNWGW